MNASDEKKLVASARSGDREAYAALVREYHVKIVSLCRSYMADLSSAEDTAQETFLKAYVALGQYREEAAFGTGLYRIAANTCKDALRHSRRRNTESLDALVHDRKIDIPDNGPAEQITAENKDTTQRLLEQLSADHPMVLSLRELSGLTYDEIAATLNISLDAVKARLKRARKEAVVLLRHFSPPPHV